MVFSEKRRDERNVWFARGFYPVHKIIGEIKKMPNYRIIEGEPAGEEGVQRTKVIGVEFGREWKGNIFNRAMDARRVDFNLR